MKVLAAHMSAECNEHIAKTLKIEDFEIYYGNDSLLRMHVEEVFKEEDVTVIPSIFARINPNGMIERKTFDFIAQTIIDDIQENLHEIDGIYLQLHGASGVLDSNTISGEHMIVKMIRDLVGPYMPIALVLDPHGNLTTTLGESVNIVRCCRESPHMDYIETEQLVARKLCELIKHRRPMKPIIKKLPIMVGGERSVSAKEPMRSINQLLDQGELDERVFVADRKSVV